MVQLISIYFPHYNWRRLHRYTFSRTTHSNLFLSKVKGVLLIPSKFKNALPSCLAQGFNLMTSLKIIMTSSLKAVSYGLTACSLH
jgi:hypothetical protein